MSYETLDNIADSFIPILAILSLLSIILQVRFDKSALRKAGGSFVLLLCLVVIVYALMFSDNYFHIWSQLGGLDYSTHTALSLVLTLYLMNAHKKYRVLLGLLFVAYLLLMLYQKYHTVSDILVTGLVVGLMSFGVFKLMKKI